MKLEARTIYNIINYLHNCHSNKKFFNFHIILDKIIKSTVLEKILTMEFLNTR